MDQFPIMGVPDGGDTAWMLVSSALVLLMTPGLAFFYGGMVRSKSVLNMIMMSISAMGVVTVLWAFTATRLRSVMTLATSPATRANTGVSKVSSASMLLLPIRARRPPR